MILPVGRSVLEANDDVAAGLRRTWAQQGLKVVNLISAPGSGKTAWLVHTLQALQGRAAALVGDLETDLDAHRLAASGAPVRQINTDGLCHLDAALVERHLRDWDLSGVDTLFLENVGNLVCPIAFDLGEHLRVVMLSAPEGEDKPLKYAPAFRWAELVLLSKMDLAPALDYDFATAFANVQQVHPGVPVIPCSSRSRLGLECWLEQIGSIACV